MKKCPFCSEWIIEKATVCRFCFRELPMENSHPEERRLLKNYYEILELDQSATNDEIKSKYRLLIHAWHPDKFPDGNLRINAAEKMKQVNEAYDILSDPVKREVYDKTLQAHFPSPEQPSYSSEPQTTQSETEKVDRCQSCGLPVKTKYVEFYENIGMIWLRRHRSIKGNFCRPCIDYYFWNFTGRTFLFGWWGLISFFITPIIILNNFIRYITSAGLIRPPIQISPSPSPFWVFSTIGGLILLGYFMYSTFMSFSNIPKYSPTPPIRYITGIYSHPGRKGQ